MSERDDSDRQGTGKLAAVALVLLLLAASGFTLWWNLAARQQPRQGGGGGMSIPPGDAVFDERVEIALALPADGALASATASVRRRDDARAQAQEAAAALLDSERPDRGPVLEQLQLRGLFLDAAGTAYLDLAPVRKDGPVTAAASDELIAIYALTNTIMQNVREVRRVRFLMNGRQAGTLAGHIDLARSFTRRTDLERP